MLAGHRWEYDVSYRGHRCVGLPFGGVESYQWCVGCGCVIDNKELAESKLVFSKEFLTLTLDMLASAKGFQPIQAGTWGEFKLRLRKKKEASNVH